MGNSPSTWAERHPILSAVLTLCAMVALLLIGLAAVALFVTTVLSIIDGFWQLIEKGKP